MPRHSLQVKNILLTVALTVLWHSLATSFFLDHNVSSFASSPYSSLSHILSQYPFTNHYCTFFTLPLPVYCNTSFFCATYHFSVQRKLSSLMAQISSSSQSKLPKRYREIQDKLPLRTQLHSVEQALKEVKNFANAKFDEAVEAHFALNINPTKIDQAIRAIVTFPHNLCKSRRVAVITTPEKQSVAVEAGADIVGGPELISIIQNKEIKFDVLICSPDMMSKISRVGKILGPRGLLPNAKFGTVSDNLKQAVSAYKFQTYQYKADRGGVAHISIGKVSSTLENLKDNFWAMANSLKSNKPQKIGGKFFKSVYVCSTMGPSVRIKTSELL